VRGLKIRKKNKLSGELQREAGKEKLLRGGVGLLLKLELWVGTVTRLQGKTKLEDN